MLGMAVVHLVSSLRTSVLEREKAQVLAHTAAQIRPEGCPQRTSVSSGSQTDSRCVPFVFSREVQTRTVFRALRPRFVGHRVRRKELLLADRRRYESDLSRRLKQGARLYVACFIPFLLQSAPRIKIVEQHFLKSRQLLLAPLSGIDEHRQTCHLGVSQYFRILLEV